MNQEVKNILHFNVKRDKIPVHSLNAAYLAHSGIGYIQFDQFGRHTHKEMIEAIQKLQAEGMESLIIDLQDNSGGYLDAAIDIVNEFLNTDEPIVYTEGRNSRRREYRANGRGMFKNLPLMILVNQNSASAAEILAGAIQDNDRGTTIPHPDAASKDLTRKGTRKTTTWTSCTASRVGNSTTKTACAWIRAWCMRH